MANENKHIDQLITRYLSGEASNEEKQRLDYWLNKSEANKKYFDQIKFIFDKANKTHPNIDFDVDSAWNRVQSQMKYPPKVDIQSRGIHWRWISIAASIIALIGISTAIYLGTKETAITNPAIVNAVAIASQDSTKTQKLPDNTQVFLNKKSKLTYSADYGKKNREVVLTGEAYFTATHAKDKPLTVKAEETFIKDIGTAFNIKAYPGEDLIEVYVESGKVIFYSERESGITLTKGEVGVYSKKLKSFSKKQAFNENILSYKTKRFTFINAKLSDVIRQLNGVYPTQIMLKNPELKDCTITVSFDNEKIETIADIISETLELELSKTSNGYTLDGPKCDKP